MTMIWVGAMVVCLVWVGSVLWNGSLSLIFGACVPEWRGRCNSRPSVFGVKVQCIGCVFAEYVNMWVGGIKICSPPLGYVNMNLVVENECADCVGCVFVWYSCMRLSASNRRTEKQERAKDENFKDWRRRFGEATMQRLGLAQEIRDETTGDIEALLTR